MGHVRVRYGMVIMVLRAEEFALFAAEMRVRDAAGQALELQAGQVTLRLGPVEVRRLSRMVQAAWSRLVDAQFTRLLSADSPPEPELPDAGPDD
jgi:hypothetical protein